MSKDSIDKEKRFTELFRSHERLIAKIASIYTDSNEDRADLVQEIGFQLWTSLDSFSNKSKISTWIYRLSLNTALYHLKKRKQRLQVQPLNEFEHRIELKNDATYREKLNYLKRSIASLLSLIHI